MLMTPERLQYLVFVADLGSFSAAGRKIGVSASAVSQVIQNMEIDLNLKLFDRVSGQAPKLTDVGKTMYLQALEILPRLEAMEKKALSFQSGVEDTLTIAVHGFTMYPKQREAISELLKAFPHVSLNLVDVEDHAISSLGQTNGPDIAIAPVQLAQSRGVESYIIDQIQWHLVAAPSHPLAQKRTQLSQQDLLQYHQVLPAVSDFANEELIESLRFSANTINCSRFYQYREILLSGAGFGLYPAQLDPHLFEQHALKRLQLDFIERELTWDIEMTWTNALGPAGTWLIEHMME
ncbi:LysR family transcriptional regulator [Photobacterium jeanii]|uniref:LysR family transcriptional regulator n=1 Tax=Photobacterium jeanii TaxID=858640 RepID=A0A178K2N4_9GAMM|nr:LysR family transcriptional regulator [Photobacterium jeanii]OAN10993.1 LysR family transcriptional regulator [Photobacterium jeanii]PST90508.1 LysR family transcriptional regulator [Photobacterium jeanii]